jgi:hypothetical protein
MTERELVERITYLRIQKAKAKSELDCISDDLSATEEMLTELLVNEGKTATARYEGLGYYSIDAPTIRVASYRKDQEPAVFDWLRDQGYGDVIKPAVHPSTLKATIKSILEEGGEIIPEIFLIEKQTLKKHKG